jgi:hypothetical protein
MKVTLLKNLPRGLLNEFTFCGNGNANEQEGKTMKDTMHDSFSGWALAGSLRKHGRPSYPVKRNTATTNQTKPPTFYTRHGNVLAKLEAQPL